MNNTLINHKMAINKALTNLFRQPIGTLLILIMLGIAITLPLALYLSVQSTQHFLGKLSTTPQITIFMELSADDIDRQNTESTLQADKRIAKVRFIDRKTALDEMQQSLGDIDLIAMIDENPLPNAFAVTPKVSDPQAIEALQADLARLPMVQMAQIDAQWVRTLYHIETFLRQVLLFLAITLSLAFVLVSHNTIRLQTLARKDEIEITHLLGAPASFIRRPFLYLALSQGLLSLLVGLGFCAYIIFRAKPQLAGIFEPYGLILQWRFFNWQEMAIIVLLVIFLSMGGAWLAVHKHLQQMDNH